MRVWIQDLQLEHFRNYTQAKLAFKSNLTVLEGPNAMGKSNILEALALLSMTRSPRASKEEYVIQNGQDTTRLICNFKKQNKLCSDNWLGY